MRTAQLQTSKLLLMQTSEHDHYVRIGADLNIRQKYLETWKLAEKRAHNCLKKDFNINANENWVRKLYDPKKL